MMRGSKSSQIFCNQNLLIIAVLAAFLCVIVTLVDTTEIGFGSYYAEHEEDANGIEYAIRHNLLSRLRQLLATKPNLAYTRLPTSKTTLLSTTPLHIAIEQGNLVFAKILVDNGADIDSTNEDYGASALHWAVWLNADSAIINFLLDQTTNRLSLLNTRDLHGRTPLALAVSNHNIDAVRLLVRRRANPNTVDTSGCNAPLFANVQLESHMCNGDDNVLNRMELFCPARFIARALIEAGAVINAVDRCTGDNAIQMARKTNKQKLSEYLHLLSSTITGVERTTPKMNVSYRAFRNYTTLPNVQCVSKKGSRLLGGITMNDAADCAAACNADPQCFGFNLMITASSGANGNGCVTKTFGCVQQSDWQFVFYEKVNSPRPPTSMKRPAAVRPRSMSRETLNSNACYPGRRSTLTALRLTDNYAEKRTMKCIGGSSRLVGFAKEAQSCARICLRNIDCIGFNVNLRTGNCEAYSYGCRQLPYADYTFYLRRQLTTEDAVVTAPPIVQSESMCVSVSPPWVSHNEQTTVTFTLSGSPCYNLTVLQRSGREVRNGNTEDLLNETAIDPSGQTIKIYNATAAINGDYLFSCPAIQLEYPIRIKIGVEPYIVSVTMVISQPDSEQVFTLNRYPSPHGRNFPDVFSLAIDVTRSTIGPDDIYILNLIGDEEITLTVVVATGLDPVSLSSSSFELKFISEVETMLSIDEDEQLPVPEFQKTLRHNYEMNVQALAQANLCHFTALLIARLQPGHEDRDLIVLKFTYEPIVTDITVNLSPVGGDEMDKCQCTFTCHVAVCPNELTGNVQFEWSFSNSSLMGAASSQGQYLVMDADQCLNMFHQAESSNTNSTISCRLILREDASRRRPFSKTLQQLISDAKSVGSWAQECRSNDQAPDVAAVGNRLIAGKIEPTLSASITCTNNQYRYFGKPHHNCSLLLTCQLPADVTNRCRLLYQWAFYDNSLVSKPANFREGNVAANPTELFLNSTVFTSLTSRFSSISFLQQSFRVACRVKNSPNQIDDHCQDVATSTVTLEQSLYQLLQTQLN